MTIADFQSEARRERVKRPFFGGGVFMIERISEVWCKTMHRSAMWPIHGKYICPECLREHVVDWAEPAAFMPQTQVDNGNKLSISSTTATVLR
jgi:hypothetical protein